MIETLIKGKIRVKLLARLFLNPNNTVYLRGLEREFGVSSNTVRLELNRLAELSLIRSIENQEGNLKEYKANTEHPLFENLRSFILKQFGLESLIERVFNKLGPVDSVYLTHDWAMGKMGPIMDLIVVGAINHNYLFKLIQKAEPIINCKIRVAIFDSFEINEAWETIPMLRLI